MNRSHIKAHAHVVASLGGQQPRYPQQTPIYQEGHSSQINAPRRNPRNNFRDRSNRRKTTGFEEIRQEYFQIHHNKARAEPAEEVSVHRPIQSVDDTQDFFPKPSAFIKTPHRQLPPRRPRPNEMDSSELLDAGGFRTRGSKAADMFARRRERTDQFILDQENAIPPPVAQPPMPQSRPTIQVTKKKPQYVQPPKQQPRMQQHAPVQAKRTPPPQSRPHHQPQQQQYQQQQHHQEQYQQQQYQQQQYQQQPRQQQHRQPTSHTTVDSRRTRQPLAPVSQRFSANSPWKDRNMQVGKRFHPNVVPYQESYNTTPKGWGRASTSFGEDNNIKQHYEYTDMSEKFQFSPAPRINKFGSGLKTPSKENYNSRPKSWCDIELTATHSAPPTRRAYPSAQRQHSESSVNQFAGHSGWGYGESDEL